MRLEGDEWRQFFDSFRRSAFRLETFPQYGVATEVEEFQRFLRGEQQSPTELATDQWLLRLAKFAASGRIVQRVHTLIRPLTDYLRFEFEWAYVNNVRAGEDIRILDFADTSNPGLPAQDYWMFDDERVVLMNYEEDGTQIDRVLLDEDVDISQYVQWKELALASAVPFTEYYARLSG